MKQPSVQRSAAQVAAGQKFAAAGRRAQAAKRQTNRQKGLPTRSKAQVQASLKWAAAGRASQARAKNHQKPLAKAQRALAGVPSGALAYLAEANRSVPCCAATTVAYHLYMMRGILATPEDILTLHEAGGGDGGALLPELFEIASSGFAGARVSRFWPLTDMTLPGAAAGLRLPSGMHAALLLPGGACVSWGRSLPIHGVVEEAWWAEWE